MHLTVNGAGVEVDDRHESTPLLWVLRDVLEPARDEVRLRCRVLRGVHRPDRRRATRSPARPPAGRAVGRQVTTVEGASGPVVDAVRDALASRTTSFNAATASRAQTLAAIALLETDPSPDDADDLAMDERQPLPLRDLPQDT